MTKKTLLDRQDCAIKIYTGKTNAILEDLGCMKVITFDITRQGNTFPAVAIFLGNSSKTSVHSYFQSIANRDAAIQRSIKSMFDWESRKTEQREKRKSFVHTLKVGSILVASWGYDQTNIDYYQVTEVKAKHVILREIAGKSVERETGCSMSCYMAPEPDRFISEPFERLVTEGNYVKVDRCRHAHIQHGVDYCSWYR